MLMVVSKMVDNWIWTCTGGGRQLAGGGESEQEGLQEEVEDVEFRFHGVAGRLPLEKRGVSGTF